MDTAYPSVLKRRHRIQKRDRWHLTSRWKRKISSHTIGVMLCQQEGLSLLSPGDLIED